VISAVNVGKLGTIYRPARSHWCLLDGRMIHPLLLLPPTDCMDVVAKRTTLYPDRLSYLISNVRCLLLIIVV
jgi:hypothetical protein